MKKSAVDRVIEKLEAERAEIARTIDRLKAAKGEALMKSQRTRKPKPVVAAAERAS